MQRVALIPGSFDPITVAHVDMINRSLGLFDKIVIGIGLNTNKQGLIAPEVREQMIQSVFEHEPKIQVSLYEGLTVDFCKQVGANYLVRGIRSVSDFEYEKAIAQVNYTLVPEIETIFILSKPEYTSVSSTIVRELLKYNGNVEPFVPQKALHFLEL